MRRTAEAWFSLWWERRSECSALGLITSWTLYAERQDYRLEARPEISDQVMRGFDRRGAWMLAIGGTAAAGLVAAEYLLLPRTDGVPVAAWIAGAAGVAGAAVGVAYAVSSDQCEPMAVIAGERTSRSCYRAHFGRLVWSAAHAELAPAAQRSARVLVARLAWSVCQCCIGYALRLRCPRELLTKSAIRDILPQKQASRHIVEPRGRWTYRAQSPRSSRASTPPLSQG
jgi:hypothetical protein